MIARPRAENSRALMHSKGREPKASDTVEKSALENFLKMLNQAITGLEVARSAPVAALADALAELRSRLTTVEEELDVLKEEFEAKK